MKKFVLKLICVCVAASLMFTLVASAAEVGTTAPLSLQTTGAAVKASDARAAYKDSARDARILLRTASGAATPDSLDNGSVLDENGIGMNDRVLTSNGFAFTAAEYSYYYTSVYYQYYQQSYYYDYYYGEGAGASFTGFDCNLSPAEQYVPSEDGSKITFADYFDDLTVGSVEQFSYYARLALENGLELSAEDEDEIKTSLASFAETAADYGLSIDEFIEMQYGEGISAYILVNIMRKQFLAEKYEDFLADEIGSAVTDAEIEKQYADNRSAYDTVSLRVFRFPINFSEDGTSNDSAEQQKAADAFIAKVTDEDSFAALAAETDPEYFSSENSTSLPEADYATITQYMGEDAAKWCFSADRKAGEISSFQTVSAVYIMYIVSPAGKNEEKLPSVRHILITFNNTADEDGVTDVYSDGNTKDEAKKLAEGYLAEYNKGAKTEESFASLAEKYSEDTASLSSGGNGVEGGLYADMKKGVFVPEFEQWAYDPAREPGDTDIIETRYGYHIMYFVGRADEPAWKASIRAELSQGKVEEALNALASEYVGSARSDKEEIAALREYTLDSIAAMMA